MPKLTKSAHKARKTFQDRYGKESYQVVQAIMKGWDNHRIENELTVPKMSVAAYRANVTRGTYYPYVNMSTRGKLSGSMYRRA